ncbi:hypothetical protein GWI33_016970 [Rhynchophorus ferrugineus]|uniref:Acyltransferase 3 domain-containing protein n=1 Tax=Rhynchophorus ferrugineus TaxID=354439 RepID=A0A834M4F6_RHYFE|nr:hypothetical protein GWI33_016970 [Rhynchophorus ferrugineus]
MFFFIDEEYALMPELFYMDNYDLCMLRGSDALYCTFTFTLKALEENNTVWNIIQDVSSDPRHYNHTNLRHGICLPTICSDYYNKTSDHLKVAEDCYKKKMLPLGLTGTITKLKCQESESIYPIRTYDWIFAVFAAAYILFILTVSIYCGINSNKSSPYKRNSKVNHVLEAFSISNNWKRLTAVSTNPDHEKLKIFNGLRFATMFCVILSHTLLQLLGGPVSNTKYTEQTTKKPLNVLVLQGSYVVQTFFIISGWLFSYQFFERRMTRGQLKPAFFLLAIVYRYIRLVPTLLVVWAIHSTWLVHLSRGPYWDDFVGEEYRNCRANGWTNMLFINNLVHKNEMCLQQTWFLAADMQLFLIGLIVLYIINKYPHKVYHVFGVLLFISFVAPGIVAYWKNHYIVQRQLPETVYDLRILKQDIFHDMLTSPLNNMFGFYTGMLAGYLFLKYKDCNLKNRKVMSILWWLMFAIAVPPLQIAYFFYDPNYQNTRIGSAMFWMFGKALFVIGATLIYFGMTYRLGGLVYWFFSRDIMLIIGRLTYSCYLVHVVFVKMPMGYKRYPIYANDNIFFLSVFSDVCISYLTAFLLCMLIEMPVSALQKLMLPKEPKAVENSRDQDVGENLCSKV